MDGREISRKLWELLNDQEASETKASGQDTEDRLERGDLIPVTRSMMCQIADALGKCCDGGACPWDVPENPPTQRIIDAINTKEEKMDTSDKAKHYLKLTEGSEDGKPEGTPRQYIEQRMQEGTETLSSELMSEVQACYLRIEKIEDGLDRRSMGDQYRGDKGLKRLLKELKKEQEALGRLLKEARERGSNG